MKDWKTTAILLCSYGLLKELQPSEFYLTEYLINHKKFTEETIIHETFPLSTYTYFGALPFIFLFTDYLRYRPIIFLQAASLVITYALLIWSHGLFALKIIRIFHGITGAAEIAYLTYIYAKVDKGHYKQVTSYTHCAALVGTLIASIISQFLVSYHIMDFHDLNYISLSGVSCALVLAAFLPSTKESMYFNRKQSIFPNSILNRNFRVSVLSQKLHNLNEEISSNELATISSSMKKQSNTTDNDNQSQIIVIHQTKVSIAIRIGGACRYLLKHFKEAYSNSYVLKWSSWWAIAMATHLQVVEYYELLWAEIAPEGYEHDYYNGGVNAVQCALSAIFALSVGFVQIYWFKWGETVLCLVSISQGIALAWMSQTNNIIIAYCLYIFYRTLYQVLITVASAEIAEKISEDSHGLVFGFNTFLAVFIQTILTIIVSDKNVDLDIRPHFLVYGGYCITLGCGFILVALYIFCKHGCIQLSWKVPKVEPKNHVLD